MYYGTIDVFNPKINTANYEILQAHVRYHCKGATSAFFEKKGYSLCLQDYKEQNVDVSLLGMRMDNTWKLNALFNDPSRIREMTATQIWEEFDEANSSVNEAGARMEYVELILDNRYQGLYTLVEPVDEKKLNLDRNDILYKVTDWGIPTDADIVEAIEKQWRSRYDIRIRYPEVISDFSIAWFPERDYLNAFYRGLNQPYEDIITKVDISNIVDKQIFIMVTSAQDNTHKNTYLAARVDTPGIYIMYQVPWDFDLTFGNYFNSDAHNSRAYNPDYTVVYKEQVLTTLLDANPDEMGDYIMSRWREYRKSFLDTEYILDLMTENRDWLVDTGAALRERNRWPEEEIDTDIDYLLDYQTKRMEWLDWYFGE